MVVRTTHARPFVPVDSFTVPVPLTRVAHNAAAREALATPPLPPLGNPFVGSVASAKGANAKKVSYAAAFLSPEAKAALLSAFPATLNKVYAHHMTIAFRPSQALLDKLELGQTVTLRVVGYAEDDKAQAVVVEAVGVESQNAIAHVTIATDGTPPVYSNELVAKGYTPVDNGLQIEARIGLALTNGKVVFK